MFDGFGLFVGEEAWPRGHKKQRSKQSNKNKIKSTLEALGLNPVVQRTKLYIVTKMEQIAVLEFKSYGTLFIILVNIIVFSGACIVLVVGCLSRRFHQEHYQEGQDATATATTTTNTTNSKAEEESSLYDNYLSWWTPSLLIVLGCATMTMGGVITACGARTTIDHHISPLGPILYLLGLLLSFVGRFIHTESRSKNEQLLPKSKGMNSRLSLYLYTTSCLVIPGLILLAEYCAVGVAYFNTYDYHDIMRVTGWQVDEISLSVDGKTTHMFSGKPQVTFGGRWGCPTSPETWCTDASYDPDCVKEDYQEAEDCIRDKFGLYDMALNSTNVNKSIPPGEDMDWPYSGYFYGGCGSCSIISQAQLDVQFQFADRILKTGFGLVVAGFFIYMCSIVRWVAHSACWRDEKTSTPLEANTEDFSNEPQSGVTHTFKSGSKDGQRLVHWQNTYV